MCENKDDTSLQDLEWIHLHKTAALLKVSATSGAILAGATDEDIKNLEVYAEKIGLAFQIADDILDVTATSEELGKTAGKDEEVNKTTYVKLLGLEESKKEGKLIEFILIIFFIHIDLIDQCLYINLCTYTLFFLILCILHSRQNYRRSKGCSVQVRRQGSPSTWHCRLHCCKKELRS